MKYLTLVLLLAAAAPAAAQTARIAHFSHGGSLETLDASEESGDNFGIPPNRYERVIDSVVIVDEITAHLLGRHRQGPYNISKAELSKLPWKRWYGEIFFRGDPPQSWEEAVAELRQNYPHAKLIGSKKRKGSSANPKPAGRVPAFQKRPFQYSFWSRLTGVMALVAGGWLLEKRSAAA